MCIYFIKENILSDEPDIRLNAKCFSQKSNLILI